MEGKNETSELVRFLKFLFFSVSAGAIELGSSAILYAIFPNHYKWCYLTGLVLSVVWNFTLNRKFTFKSAANVPIAMLKVAAYYAVFTPLTTWLGGWLEGTVGWNGNVVTIVNMVLNFVTEFLYQRYFVFGKSIDTNDKSPSSEEANEEA